MSFDNDLRELLHDKAADAGPPSPAPISLIRRSRRHQVRTVVVSTFVASALVVGSFVGLSSLRADHEATPLGGENQRTVSIQNITMTSPTDWTLLDLWPIGAALPTSSVTTGSSQSGTTPVSQPEGLPVLELANFNPVPRAGSHTLCPPSPPLSGAVLYVAVDSDALASPGNFQFSDQNAELRLDGAPTDGPCGNGYYAYLLSDAGTPFLAFAAFGDAASTQTRQTVADAWGSRVISGTAMSAPAYEQPGYVIANGAIDGEPWNLESGQGTGGKISLWFVSGIGSNEQLAGPSTFSMQGGPLAPDGTIVGTSRVFWGAVAPSISRVVYRPSDGTGETDGLIAPIAGVPSADYDAFVLVTDANTPGQIVAIDQDGTETAMTASTKSDVDIKNAESTLRNALVAALTYRQGHGFTGFTPDEALKIEPSLTYNTSPTAIPGEVSIRDVQKDSIVLVTATPNGFPLCIAADQSTSPNTTYGATDAATVAECNDPAWP
jgi:hypothetical protein